MQHKPFIIYDLRFQGIRALRAGLLSQRVAEFSRTRGGDERKAAGALRVDRTTVCWHASRAFIVLLGHVRGYVIGQK